MNPDTRGIETIWGAATIERLDTKQVYEILRKHNIQRMDSSYIYEAAETILGNTGASKEFTIDIKSNGFSPKALSKDSIMKCISESLNRLKVDKVDRFYFHSPDPETPLSESLDAIHKLYKDGKFKHFGLSNFSCEQVKQVYDHSKSQNYILPSLYQGNYNILSRHNESDLIPLLRELGIKFIAYSPIAGGFLTKSVEQLNAKYTLTGRWNPKLRIGALYNSLYNKPEMLNALQELQNIADELEISKAELGCRWLKYHSMLQQGDGIIIGNTKLEQLQETIHWLQNGPLPQKSIDKIDKIWTKISHVAPRDNYSGFIEAKLKL